MEIKSVDPSMAFGFLCKTHEEFEQFCQSVEELNSDNKMDIVFDVQPTTPNHSDSKHKIVRV
jgi:hypothetical protein